MAVGASPIRVCFTGRNRAGSWEVRGKQIASTRENWYANQEVDVDQIDDFDLFCFVKKPIPKLIEKIRARKKPVVFDVIDSWAQPTDNDKVTNAAEAQALFAEKWSELPRFDSYIFANKKMHSDLGGLVGHSTYIYHHHREHLPRKPVRKTVRTIGYEGNDTYLGEWRDIIERLCEERSLQFVTDTDTNSDLDIGFACRGSEHACYLSNNYKSNVKLANFYGTGTPAIVHADDRSYHETDCGDVLFFKTPEQLARQIDRLLNFEYRQAIHQRFLKKANDYEIEYIANTFEHYFMSVLRLYQDGRLG